MKILMLVISSDTFPVYAKHREVWRLYMKSHPDIDCYFIHYRPEAIIPILTKDTLFLRGIESYGGITRKTIESLQYFFQRGKPYTHVVRTNLSSVWDFKELIAFLETQPKTGLYSGIINNNVENKAPYVSGAGIVMSIDIAQMLVQLRNFVCSVGVSDDVDFGHTLSGLGISPVHGKRVDFVSLKHYEEHHDKTPEGTYHYRVRHENYMGNRMEEPEIMRRIVARIYNK
jgi:hypothetical protein